MKIKRKKGEEKFFQPFFLLISFCLIAFLLFSNLKIEKKKRELARKVENLNFQIEQLEQKREALKKALSEAQKEIYWEKLAREQGYVKEGEEAIVIKKIESEKEEREMEQNIWFKIWQEIKDFLKK